MDCKQAESLYIDYYDKSLPEEQCRALEAHLKTCSACQESWAAYQRMIEEVSGLHPLTPPEEFVQSVKQKIRRRSKGRFFRDSGPHSVRFAIVSFVLIILFILAYLVLIATSEIRLIQTSPDSASDLEDEGASGKSPPPVPRGEQETEAP